MRYSAQLLSWNRKHNLLSRADEANLVRKHVAASLGVFLCSPYVSGQRWIDVGTGAGFPGLILQLAEPAMPMTLLDSSRKRCDFLDAVTTELSPETKVINQRAEDFIATGDPVDGYDVVTTKAVASLDECIRRFGSLVRPGGRLLTFKGPQWSSELEEAATSQQFQSLRFVPESATRVPWIEAHIVTLFRQPG
ncbi:MAG: 16S rRNA (guanine(527)-N(7))-methyltransferase RsmG [Candidatus Eisenbacteria bacterium]|uniref:Ribosomal RNA small subunit methyltransferase G n=1 Tax=Eiseniibacteriota bacterium TaxID=2212470 RepID=A0A956NBG9_UNCEI|nr:16S rRNA (guanine(527)-N(7))-methyltransferase RsmG [Candidatus Eisenbacteria bacterium]MCB9465991.1 16S rRNA (guanine(527)-N(7))-methyltransferase RsmG [Candidatus Eisenbacteria bacterium]